MGIIKAPEPEKPAEPVYCSQIIRNTKDAIEDFRCSITGNYCVGAETPLRYLESIAERCPVHNLRKQYAGVIQRLRLMSQRDGLCQQVTELDNQIQDLGGEVEDEDDDRPDTPYDARIGAGVSESADRVSERSEGILF